jgi:hypothetical protein
MIWSPEEELQSTVKRVRDHCVSIKPKGVRDEDEVVSSALDSLPPIAVGAERDMEEHKEDKINVEPYKVNDAWQPLKPDPIIAPKSESGSNGVKQQTVEAPRSSAASVTDIDKSEEIVIDDDDDDDEVEIICVRDSNAKMI